MTHQKADEVCQRHQAYRNALVKQTLWEDELQLVKDNGTQSDYLHALKKLEIWDNEVLRLRSELTDAIDGLIQYSNSKLGSGAAWEIVQLMHRITFTMEEQPC